MVTIAEFSVDPGGFPLGSVFAQLADAEVELERLVPTNDALVPYFWLRGARTDGLVDAFGDRPEVKRLELVDEVDDEYLLRVEWEPEAEGILKAIADTPVSLLTTVGTSEEWRFEVRGEDAGAISAFQARCREYGVPVELVSLNSLSPMRSSAEYDLTETQREALVLAYEHGYYRSPREVTLDELARELGITGQSLGSRLRRGTNQLIGTTLVGPSATE